MPQSSSTASCQNTEGVFALSRHNQILGNFGESFAVNFLRKNGYRILERNYKTKTAEIDIITQKGEYIIFIEVKTRQTENFGRPAEAVDRRKQQKIIAAAATYMQDHPGVNARFDVVEIIADRHNGKFLPREIEHIEEAFTC